MKRTTIATLSGGAVVGAATVLMVVQMLAVERTGEVRAADGPGSRETPSSQAIRVEVMQPSRRPLTRPLKMPATLTPGESADLYAKTSGYVSTVAVDIGDRVRKGAPLLTIDVPEMLDELEQAKAVREAKRAKVQALVAKRVQAESMIVTALAEVQQFVAEQELWKVTLDRKQQLREAKAIPEQDFDEARSRFAVVEAKLRIARAKVASAEARKRSVGADTAVARSEVAVEEARLTRLKTLVAYATIRAPFDGVITDRRVDPGAFVRSAAEGTTTPLLTIANVSYIRLALAIPESDARYVRIGTEVDVDVKALGSEPIRATVTRTARALQADTRTMRVEVDLDNRGGSLVPGMYAHVVVKLESKQQALVIPSKAIRVRGRETSVLVAEGAIARTKPVLIGYDDGIWAEVLSGLSGEEQIIVSSAGSVAPGAPIIPVPAGSSSA